MVQHMKKEHSTKVPRLYKTAAQYVEKVMNGEASLKTLLSSEKKSNIQALYDLILKCISNNKKLETILEKSGILEKQKKLNPWLARILISELLWGKRHLRGESKPILEVLKYKEELEKFKETVRDPKEGLECLKVKNELRKPCYVRVNTLRTSVDEMVKCFVHYDFVEVKTPSDYNDFLTKAKSLKKGHFMRDFNVPELLVFAPNTQLKDDPLTLSYSIFIQDKAHCLAVRALCPPQNSVVLDMCAGPGYKTDYMAALMKDKGKIFALDINARRVDILREVIGRSGCSCVEIKHQDTLTFTNENVEYILVDVPCTSSGIFFFPGSDIFSKEEDEIRRNKMKGFQTKLLNHALLNFPSAKRVVYCTSSVNYEENEGVVEYVMKGRARFRFSLVKCNSFESNTSDKGSRLSPEHHLTSEFFIAVFERKWQNKTEDESLLQSYSLPELKHRRNRNITITLNRVKSEDETEAGSQSAFGKVKGMECHCEIEENREGKPGLHKKRRRRREGQKGKEVQRLKNQNLEPQIEEEKTYEKRKGKDVMIENEIEHEVDTELSEPVKKKRKKQKGKTVFQIEFQDKQNVRDKSGNRLSPKNKFEIKGKIETQKEIRVQLSKHNEWTVLETNEGSQ